MFALPVYVPPLEKPDEEMACHFASPSDAVGVQVSDSPDVGLTTQVIFDVWPDPTVDGVAERLTVGLI